MRTIVLDSWPEGVRLPPGYSESFIKKVFGVLTGPKKNPERLALIFLDGLGRAHIYRKGKRQKVRTVGEGLRVEKALFDLGLMLKREGREVERWMK